MAALATHKATVLDIKEQPKPGSYYTNTRRQKRATWLKIFSKQKIWWPTKKVKCKCRNRPINWHVFDMAYWFCTKKHTQRYRQWCELWQHLRQYYKNTEKLFIKVMQYFLWHSDSIASTHDTITHYLVAIVSVFFFIQFGLLVLLSP